jgi:hypothetical protein
MSAPSNTELKKCRRVVKDEAGAPGSEEPEASLMGPDAAAASCAICQMATARI